MTRAQASNYLRRKHRIVHTPGYLANLATRGLGPPYTLKGRNSDYQPAGLDAYAAEITRAGKVA